MSESQPERLIPYGAEPDKPRTGLYVSWVLVVLWYLFLAAMVIITVRSR